MDNIDKIIEDLNELLDKCAEVSNCIDELNDKAHSLLHSVLQLKSNYTDDMK